LIPTVGSSKILPFIRSDFELQEQPMVVFRLSFKKSTHIAKLASAKTMDLYENRGINSLEISCCLEKFWQN
jgi:hypothetical protein